MQETNKFNFLPPQAAELARKVYDKIKDSTDDLSAQFTALNYVSENFKPVSEAKSMFAPQVEYNYDPSKNYVDVMLGKAGLDSQGEVTTENFWKTSIQSGIKGDIEHYYKYRADGYKMEDNPDYEGWVAKLEESWWDEDKMVAMGRVSYPMDHPYTPTFLSRWQSGELGVSIEPRVLNSTITYDDNLNPVINTGDVIRFSFTSNPVIDTKPE